MRRTPLLAMSMLAAAGCNSLVGFDLEGGEDGGGGDTKTLIVTRTGDRRGTVTSMPSGINCSPTVDNCTEDFPRGSIVTLAAVGSAGSRFVEWTGGCTGDGACSLTLGIDTSVEARFEDASGGHNFAFVTHDTYSPTTFSLLSNADAICANEAAAGGLPGGATYVAWLSTSTVDATTRLGAARGWVRPDGQPVADTVADLASGKLRFPLSISARGVTVPVNVAGHATAVTGTTYMGIHSTSTCSDWSAETMALVGNATYTGDAWTDWGVSTCAPAHLYCFGVDRMEPLVVTAEPGRLAFLTAAQWTPGGGRAAADAFCQMEADSAGRSGTFKALLALTTESAASRFNLGGAPWVRPDGIPIAPRGVSPFERLQTPINVTASGDYRNGWAFTGADSPTAMATNRNCNDWNDGTSSRTTIPGIYVGVSDWFKAADSVQVRCDESYQLYCLEQ